MKKILILSVLISIYFFNNTLLAQSSIDKQSVTGSWMGKLEINSVSLRIIFNLSPAGKDSLAVTLDSPDQGAKDIKIGPVTFSGDSIIIAAPSIMGIYNGAIKNDTIIEGNWKQAGNSWPLNLAKLRVEFILKRPQEPKPPFPYVSEDVIFQNEKAGISLGGTLTTPQGDGPFTSVILITGSGSQNRNEELMGHKPFLVISDYLTRNGVAVFRYDDRGVGQSQASASPGTSADFATDVDAAFKYLKTNKKINPQKIGLAGHSEGGLIAPIAASENREIAFIISIAGTGVSGEKILYRQIYDINKASGMNEKDAKSSVSESKEMYAILKKEPDDKKAAEKMTAIVKKNLIKKKTSEEDTKTSLQQFQSSAGTLTSAWFRYFLFTDPADYWKKVKCPVLALNGDKDLQVSAEINLPGIEKALRSGGNNRVKTMRFPDLNHLFQHCKTGSPSEYGSIEETFSPEVLKVMSDWILAL